MTNQEEMQVTSATQGKVEAEEKKDGDDIEQDQLYMGDDNLRYLESDDVESKQEGMWKKLWDSMNPSVCLTPAAACTNVLLEDETVDYNGIVPPMLRDIQNPGKQRTAALQQLYRFTDRERQGNRVPVICSTRFHTLDAVVPCLAVDVAAHDRRQALLVLNNLCIPTENKRTILLGPSRDDVLSSLLEILRQKLPECHFAVACLFNLSFYEDTKGMLLQYVPSVDLKHTENDTPEQYTFSQPTDKKDSLLRILEDIVGDFLPLFVQHQNSLKASSPQKKKVAPSSVEELTLRWTMCVLRNLATVTDHAILLATTTTFPAVALEVLKVASENADLSLWSHDSLPEACLVLWVWLVKASDETRQHLKHEFGQNSTFDAEAIFKPIAEQPGIQGVRAKLVAHQLQTALNTDEARSLASF